MTPLGLVTQPRNCPPYDFNQPPKIDGGLPQLYYSILQVGLVMLLPVHCCHIESYYNINYAITSCIWVSNAVGFILIAAFSHKIQPWFGKRNSLPIGNALVV